MYNLNKESKEVIDETIKEKKSVRLNWIDVAKGICIIAVILGHMGKKI